MVIKLFADGADLATMRELVLDPKIEGFTTNPTLAKKAGVKNYREFGIKALEIAGDKPVSIEVLADDLAGMERQAREIDKWGPNVFVKIPVMTSRGEPTYPVISRLSKDAIPLNVTAVFTQEQVEAVGHALAGPSIVSIFAGRIADAGVDPEEHVLACCVVLAQVCPQAKMLWASPRQAYDATLAERCGCEIITMTPDLISKLSLRGKTLEAYSQETVAMFYRDAQAAGYTL